jgi:hypothetical protein
MSELLPTPYYHLFYLTHELNPLIIRNRKALFKLLLMPLPKPLSIMAGCPLSGADCGIRWCYTPGDSNSIFIHMHCIVTGGGLMGKWVQAKRVKDNFVSRKEFEQDVQSHFPERTPKWS